MAIVDVDGLTTSQAELLAHLRDMESPETWFLFVNGGFTFADAKALFDRGLAEISKQMGMPAARLNLWVKHDGGPCPVDGEQRVMVRWKEDEGAATHRAGVFNWATVASYRLAPNPEHSQ